MRHPKNRAVTLLWIVPIVLSWGVLLYFDFTQGSKPVLALPLVHWVLLIITLLVMTVWIVGVELGLIPRWRDDSESRLKSLADVRFSGVMLICSSILLGGSNWDAIRLSGIVIGGYMLLIGAATPILEQLRRSKSGNANGPNTSIQP